jgi:hypothetical protein
VKHYLGDRLATFGTRLKGDSTTAPVVVANRQGQDLPAIDQPDPSAAPPLASNDFAETRLQPLPAPTESIATVQNVAPTLSTAAPTATLNGPAEPVALIDPGPADRVADLLKQAERQLHEEKLLAPADDSALATYREILALDPANPAATIGLEAARTQLIQGFAVALKERDIPRARQLLQDLRVATADKSGLEKFADELAAAEKRQQSPRTDSVGRSKEAGRSTRVVTERAGSHGTVPNVAVARSMQPPANAVSRDSGLKAIADRLKERAIVKQRQGELLESQALVAEGLRVQPSHGGLQRLREALDHQLQSQAAQRVEPESFAVKTVRTEPTHPRDKPLSSAKDANFNFGTF